MTIARIVHVGDVGANKGSDLDSLHPSCTEEQRKIRWIRGQLFNSTRDRQVAI